MKKQKLTAWFPVRVNPMRVGEYEVEYPEHQETRRRYWNGKEWTIERGAIGGTLFGVNPKDKWRGLAKEPK